MCAVLRNRSSPPYPASRRFDLQRLRRVLRRRFGRQPQNTVSVAELLRAWTAGGSYDLVRENDFGTLEAGKLADICVLDRDVFAVDPKDARDIQVSLTLSDGRVVYEDC